MRTPFAGLAGIIQIEHGSDGVHAEAVDMVFIEPEKRVGNQIVLDFVAAVIVDQRAPVWMGALARIRMFVEMRAIELRKAVGITRKMRGSPIQKDANAGLVTAIHKLHEFRGTAKAAGRGGAAEMAVAP